VLATREDSLLVIEEVCEKCITNDTTYLIGTVKSLKKSTCKTMRNLAATFRAIGGRLRYRDADALAGQAKKMTNEGMKSEKTCQRGNKAVEVIPVTLRAAYRSITVRCAGENTARRLLSLHNSTLWGDFGSKSIDRVQSVVNECILADEASSRVRVTLCARHLSVSMRVQVQALDGCREGAVALVKGADIKTDIRLPVHNQHAEPVVGFV